MRMTENSWLCIEMRVGCSVGFWGICGVLFFKRTSRHHDFRFINDVKDQYDYNVKSELFLEILSELVFELNFWEESHRKMCSRKV